MRYRHRPLPLFLLTLLCIMFAAALAPADPARTDPARTDAARTAAAPAEAIAPNHAAETYRAALITTRFTSRSHANALATKFFTGYPTDEGLTPSKLNVVSMYVDQSQPDDMAHQLADRFDVRLCDSISEALTLGGDELAVDAVIYIGVHGDYLRSRLGAKMYPHLRHLAEVFAVFDATGQTAPVYCDKELGYRWGDAKWIYERARELGVPMMAGSTLPVVWRDPALPTPKNKPISEAVAVGYGPLNSYFLHSVEILLSMLEHQAQGVAGVESVQWLSGEDVFAAAERGDFSMELVEAACATIDAKKPGTLQSNGERSVGAVIIQFRDGTCATAVHAPNYIGEHFAFAAKVDGEVLATEFAMPHDRVFPHFSYLFLNVERMIETGKPAWPLERNLLSNGIIDAAMRSAAAGGEVVATPHLNEGYPQPDTEPILPTSPRPTGRSTGPWPPEGFEFTAWPE